MSGRIESIKFLILLFSLFVITTDLIWGKIFNWFTVPVAVGGIATSFYLMGWQGLEQSLLGLIAGLLLYGWMFGLHFIGGGDVKFLMALGTWGGLHYTEEVALLGIVIGGVISLISLIITGRIVDFCKRMYSFLLSIFIKWLEPEPFKIDKTLTIPFGVPISIAAIWTAFAHPLENFGVVLWP